MEKIDASIQVWKKGNQANILLSLLLRSLSLHGRYDQSIFGPIKNSRDFEKV